MFPREAITRIQTARDADGKVLNYVPNQRHSAFPTPRFPNSMKPPTPSTRTHAPSTSTRKIWIIVQAVVLCWSVGLSVFIWKAKKEKKAAEIARDVPVLPSGIGFERTIPLQSEPLGPAPGGMVWIPGGEFSMGSDSSGESLCSISGVTRDAQPIHRVSVDPFWMDATEVTNAEFARFVAATGYVTVAEKTPSAEEFPGAPPENLVAGSTVFTATAQPVDLDNYFQWWNYVHGADWRHPAGPGSDLKGKEKYPVVQVAYDDAAAYAAWAGKRLPTEAEWEFAARGGAAGKLYAWGDDLKPGGKFQANIYEGKFPVEGGDTGEDGFKGIAPVAQYAPNPYGLYDVAGNVWEWCSDWYRVDTYARLKLAGGISRNPQGPATSYDPAEPDEKKRVHRGGSFLCTDQYCTRYMVGTRGKGDVNTASNHLGFRCVRK